MSLKAKLLAYGLGAALIIAMITYCVYQVNKIFDTLSEQATTIEQLQGEKSKLTAEKNELNQQLLDASNDQKAKDDINNDLRYQNGQIDKSYAELKKELEDYRKAHPTAPEVQPVPGQGLDTLEVDLAWRAYCKAVPGGCPEGVKP